MMFGNSEYSRVLPAKMELSTRSELIAGDDHMSQVFGQRATIKTGLALFILGAVSLLEAPTACLGDESPAFQKLGDAFRREIRPILDQHCMKCHAADVQEGTLDLEQFATLDDVRRSTTTWVKVAEMLDNGEMPPKKAPQPVPERRKRLRGWVADYLKAEARASAGDPGPVVLRRLGNAEYTYTLMDLIGVDLQPAREFPVDGAAGEGFTNTGNALVMSPALLSKYLDAGKKIADHAVLLPDGIRFSPSATRRDWTDEVLAKIRTFYGRFSDAGGGTNVNLQGIVFGTNQGGRLPLERYLEATIRDRANLASGAKSVALVARERGLNAKYLGILWSALNEGNRAPVLEVMRAHWREASAQEAHTLVAEIGRWQNALWRFASVGHIGKVGGPKAWMEPVTPIAARQELRLKMPTSSSGDVTLSLVAGDAGDGHEHDFVVWDNPRLVAPGRPDLLLRDVREVVHELASLRERAFNSAAKCLGAAAEASVAQGKIEVPTLARRHGVDPLILEAWLDYLGISTTGAGVKVDSVLTGKITKASGFDFVNGWGTGELPNAVANSSDQHVRIPGNLKPHSVAMHPSPSLRIAAGWKSPVTAVIRVKGTVQHAHPECGNGVTWSLELRRGAVRQMLAGGVAQGGKEVPFGQLRDIAVQRGDLVSLVIGARAGNHSCDLTAVDLTLAGGGRVWDLARDVSPDVLAGNPHADGHGNAGVWYFYTEPDSGASGERVVPAGSLLARWQSASTADERQRLARELETLLRSGPPSAKDSPDGLLYRLLSSLRGPLVNVFRLEGTGKDQGTALPGTKQPAIGLAPSLFGRHPNQTIDTASLCVRAPQAVEVRLPADLVEGCEFVTGATLDATAGTEGSAQLQVVIGRAEPPKGVSPDLPIIVRDNSAARQRFEAAFNTIRQVFPPSLCYTKIVPVDEVITLTLFYREDEHLRRLMLDQAEIDQLDHLWTELRFVSQDALTMVDAFQQLLEYASQDADPRVFEPMRKPITDRATAFRRALVAAEPAHLNAIIALAERAFRRPLAAAETGELRELYRKLRGEEIPHDEAIRLVLARALISPAFLYRIEKPPPGPKAAEVSDWELASRLSYFLWSSMPDEELRKEAGAGRLHRPDVLKAQARRMAKDPRVRRLATEFACQWLHIYDFDSLDEKSSRHFPTFAALRGAMHEEAILFFTDLFQNDGSVLSVLDGDYTFLNEALAKHYGIPGVTGPEWRRVNDIRKYGRGGILAMAATLAMQSGASRTSPILRGNWVAEALLGDKLPRPPKNVPQLPDDEAATQGLTMRQLVERHTADPGCASCHSRIDAFGYALESYDAIGRRRDRDLGDRPINTAARLRDGTEFDGLDGLRRYLGTTRRDAMIRQFCRKFLGYALGRAIQLSDDLLLEEMELALKTNKYRFSGLLEAVVGSRQFREIRGRDAATHESRD
jgi:Protein of unknown function (DUF1592)/Protein of unknown function (DUF1588)/Protein of unknown function (DUF1587)/Protein of unknown function (DUF1585)/Protein of unknown function (DUF1595)/Planctomycete cytochrome C